MTPATDADFEKLGREEAKRLGVQPRIDNTFYYVFDDAPGILSDAESLTSWHDSAADAYAALGRAVHAARVATGYYDAVGRARREAIAEVFGKYSHLKIDLDDFMKEKHDESDIRALLTEKGAADRLALLSGLLTRAISGRRIEEQYYREFGGEG